MILVHVLLTLSAFVISFYYLCKKGAQAELKWFLWMILGSVWGLQIDTTTLQQSLNNIEAQIQVQEE